MKTLSAIFCAVLVAGPVFGQNLNIAKQQAKKAAGNESIQQGGAQPSTPPPQATDPALAATLQNIGSLRADFQKLDASPTNTLALKNDLAAAARGTKASSAAIARLAENLAAAMAGNKKLHPQHQKLAQYAHAIFNSAHLTAAQQQAVCDDVQKILTDGGVAADAVAKVVGSFKTIATETK